MDTSVANRIQTKMNKRLVSTDVLLSQYRMLDERSRKSSAYTDPKYIPFYYYLGTELNHGQDNKVKTLATIGFNLGLISGAFISGAKSIEYFFAFQPKEKDVYYANMGIRNVTDNYKNDIDWYVGDSSDQIFESYFCHTKWDVVIINQNVKYDQYIQYLELCWKHVNLQGSIVVDHVNYNDQCNDAYMNFCKMKNRDPFIFNTRYGVGYIKR